MRNASADLETNRKGNEMKKDITERAENRLKELLQMSEYRNAHKSHAVAKVLFELNEETDMCGVDGILENGIDIQYLNSGDTYAETLMYVDGAFKISSIGDEIEKQG